MIYPIEVKPHRVWLERVVYALMIGAVTISLLIAFSAVWEAYFNAPPIHIESLDPPDLGALQPGDPVPIHNRVTVEEGMIIHYFVSVMDATGRYNITGTQRAYTDFLHPAAATFNQELPWTVPALPPGTYTRVFAVRKVSGNEDTLFIKVKFTIGDP